MNDDFEGGEFIFTEMDAKTVTVSKSILANLFNILSPSCHFLKDSDCWISNISNLENSRGRKRPSKCIHHKILEMQPSIKTISKKFPVLFTDGKIKE